MNMHYSLSMAVIVFAASSVCAQSQGTLLARHSGAANPTTEGFVFVSSFGTPLLAPVTDDLGLDAWSTRISAASFGYQRSLPNLAGLDWRLSVTLRVVEDDPAAQFFFAGLSTGQYSFYLRFGLDANGDPSVQYTGPQLSPVFVLEGAGSTYHNYELIYNSVTHTASLWVDQTRLLDDIEGWQRTSSLLAFGGIEELRPSVQANWNLVSLEIIPEPSALALMGVGSVVVALRMLRRRRDVEAESVPLQTDSPCQPVFPRVL